MCSPSIDISNTSKEPLLDSKSCMWFSMKSDHSATFPVNCLHSSLNLLYAHSNTPCLCLHWSILISHTCTCNATCTRSARPPHGRQKNKLFEQKSDGKVSQNLRDQFWCYFGYVRPPPYTRALSQVEENSMWHPPRRSRSVWQHTSRRIMSGLWHSLLLMGRCKSVSQCDKRIVQQLHKL